jgi:hypothetical protein
VGGHDRGQPGAVSDREVAGVTSEEAIAELDFVANQRYRKLLGRGEVDDFTDDDQKRINKVIDYLRQPVITNAEWRPVSNWAKDILAHPERYNSESSQKNWRGEEPLP